MFKFFYEDELDEGINKTFLTVGMFIEYIIVVSSKAALFYPFLTKKWIY